MKNKRINLVVIFLMVITLIMATAISASAATVKINKKTVTIDAGSSVTLKITGTSKSVKWSSSSKSVAVVNSTGKYKAKVTAKKAGTAKVTAKVGKKKYICTVTVKYADGSRQNPANPETGVTVTTYSGKMYFKVTEKYRGAEAISKLKELGEWNSYEEYTYERKEAGTDLLLLKYDVKAISGFDEHALSGDNVISPYGNYNGACNKGIDDFDSVYLSKNDRFDLSLYNGAEDIMYFCAYVPDDLKSFSNYIYTKGFSQYWIKYSI